jgi:hypothetical protein
MGINNPYYITNVSLMASQNYNSSVFITQGLENQIKIILDRFQSYRDIIKNYTILYPNTENLNIKTKMFPVYTKVNFKYFNNYNIILEFLG